MAKSTRGFCKYCGKEYTRTGIAKHLQTCKKRVDLCEKAEKTEKYFELLLYGAYNKDYWLIIQIKENATLDDLDRFIRDIWVECCGHLSVFEIDGVSYEREPDDDFGSTTEIMVKVLDHYSAQKQNEKVVILSRNNPPEFACSICGNSRSLKRESFFINPTIFPLCKTIQDNLDSGNISLF